MPPPIFPRNILNRLRWSEGESLDDAEIVILHRGAPEDRKIIHGKEIISLGHMFLECVEATIPYHRVLEIRYRGELLFKKQEKGKTENR